MASSPATQPKNRLATPLKPSQLKSDIHSEWCPGCGDFGITNAIQQAVAGLGLKPWETFLVSGVGCSGKVPHYIHMYGMHTLHGRALAFAQGAKLANPKLTVIAAGGDGDGQYRLSDASAKWQQDAGAALDRADRRAFERRRLKQTARRGSLAKRGSHGNQ